MVACCLLLSACGSSSVLTEEGTNMCVQNLTITDLNEFEEFFSSAKGMHKKFVTWDKLSFLGEFDSFVLESIDPDNYRYFYNIRNDAGQTLLLRIYQTPKASPWYTDGWLDFQSVKIKENSTSMLKQAYSDDPYLIKRDIFTYCYVRDIDNQVGIPNTIMWQIDGILYSLSVASKASTWKEGNGTPVIDGLFSVDDAEFQTACDAIKQALTAK